MHKAIGNAVMLLAGLFLAGLFLAVPAAAQERDPDFLFGTPRFSVDFHLGMAAPRAGSELFDFTFDEMTLRRTDLRGATFGAGFTSRVHERVDVSAEFSFTGGSSESDYRHWKGADGLPIVQNTSFNRLPVSLTVRGYLADRGRSVGSLAWVPADWSPYVGAGVGVTWYEFTREGEFFDVQGCEEFGDCAIVYDVLTMDGAAFTTHALAGVEYSLTPRFGLVAEGRYLWASGGDRDRDFVGFDALDVSGFQGTLGLRIRFGEDRF